MNTLFKGYIEHRGKYVLAYYENYNRGTYINDHRTIGLPTNEYVTMYQGLAFRVSYEQEIRTLLIDHLKMLYLVGELNQYTLESKKFYEGYRKLDSLVTDKEFEDFKEWVEFQLIGKIDKSKLRSNVNDIFVRDTIYNKVEIPKNCHFK